MSYTPPTAGTEDWDVPLNQALADIDATAEAAQTTADGKADASHTHAESDVTNLTTDLAGKAATVHTHDTSAIVSGTLGVNHGGTGISSAVPNLSHLVGDGFNASLQIRSPAQVRSDIGADNASNLASGTVADARLNTSYTNITSTTITRGNATDSTYVAQQTGDTNPRLIVQADGKLVWGNGAAVGDTTLRRAGLNLLEISNRLDVLGDTDVGGDLSIFGIDQGRGVVSFTAITANSADIGTTETIVLTASSVPFKNGRAYEFRLSAAYNLSSATGRLRVLVRRTDLSGPNYIQWIDLMSPIAAQNQAFEVSRILRRIAGTDLTTDIVVSLDSQVASTTGRLVATSTTAVGYFKITDVGPSAMYPGTNTIGD